MGHWESKAGLVHRSLLNRGLNCVSSDEIRVVCGDFGFDFKAVLHSLVRFGAVFPLLFRGIYYVRDAREFASKSSNTDALNLAALACNKKLGKNWYFGFHAALKLSGVIGQQTLTEAAVIARKQILPKRTRVVPGLKIVFYTVKCADFEAGIIQSGEIRFSSPIRTAADAFRVGLRQNKSAYARVVRDEVRDFLGKRFALEARRVLEKCGWQALEKPLLEGD